MPTNKEVNIGNPHDYNSNDRFKLEIKNKSTGAEAPVTQPIHLIIDWDDIENKPYIPEHIIEDVHEEDKDSSVKLYINKLTDGKPSDWSKEPIFGVEHKIAVESSSDNTISSTNLDKIIDTSQGGTFTVPRVYSNSTGHIYQLDNETITINKHGIDITQQGTEESTNDTVSLVKNIGVIGEKSHTISESFEKIYTIHKIDELLSLNIKFYGTVFIDKLTDLPKNVEKGSTYKIVRVGVIEYNETETIKRTLKVGDLIIALKENPAQLLNNTDWIVVPSGDNNSDTWRPITINGGTEVKNNSIGSNKGIDFRTETDGLVITTDENKNSVIINYTGSTKDTVYRADGAIKIENVDINGDIIPYIRHVESVVDNKDSGKFNKFEYDIYGHITKAIAVTSEDIHPFVDGYGIVNIKGTSKLISAVEGNELSLSAGKYKDKIHFISGNKWFNIKGAASAEDEIYFGHSLSPVKGALYGEPSADGATKTLNSTDNSFIIGTYQPDEAGHLIDSRNITIRLPQTAFQFAYSKITVKNSTSVGNVVGNTDSVEAHEDSDLLTIAAGNKWIKLESKNVKDKGTKDLQDQIIVGHVVNFNNEYTIGDQLAAGTSSKELDWNKNLRFRTSWLTSDEAGHITNSGYREVKIPNTEASIESRGLAPQAKKNSFLLTKSNGTGTSEWDSIVEICGGNATTSNNSASGGNNYYGYIE